MNKYIRKCLIVYTSFALVLVGMAGAAYAITATDADQYVTRSQYAVDMAHLQNKLDEAEAGLMGNINRFRSTDVKFVTWDTPNNYNTGGNRNRGEHSGGNSYPLYSNYNDWSYAFGYWDGGTTSKRTTRWGASYSMYRLWNGNYFITKDLFFSSEGTNPSLYYPTKNYAVPLESHPGWYMIIRLWDSTHVYQQCLVSYAKLDPNSTTPRPHMTNVVARFKKDLFRYVGTGSPRLTTSKRSGSGTLDYYQNNNYESTFSFNHVNSAVASRTGTNIITTNSWLDEATGDYMVEISGAIANAPDIDVSIHFSSSMCTVNWVVPKDNVEYLITGLNGSAYTTMRGNFFIRGGDIGSGVAGDKWWQYEFVDCENGIKYWHAYKPPKATNDVGAATGNPLPQGIHYCLPIVY